MGGGCHGKLLDPVSKGMQAAAFLVQLGRVQQGCQ
jgi:hypothetical protein